MKRLRLWFVLFALIGAMLWFMVRGAGRTQFEAWGQALGPVAFVEVYQRTGFFDGRVEAANLHLIANRQKYLKSLFIDQVVVRTSGLMHLLSSPFGAAAELPEQFVMELNGVRGEPLPLTDELGQIWLNFKSLVPFDGFACRDSGELLDSDFGGMGLGGFRVNIGWTHGVDLGISTVDFSWDNGRFGQLEVHAEIEGLDLRQWFARQLAFEDIAIRSLRMALHTGDYLPKRNAYCAKLKEQTEEEYLDANLNLVRGFLGYRGVTVEDRLWQLWRDFNGKGGTLELRADYGNAFRLARLDGQTLSQAFDLLKLRIKTTSGGEVPLRFQDFVLPELQISAQLPPGESVVIIPDGTAVTTDPGATSEVPDEAATDTEGNPLSSIASARSLGQRVKGLNGEPATTAKPAKPKVQVARGPQVIDYSQISAYMGRDLIFILNNGQRYRARPRAVNAKGVDLYLILRGGTANMTISRDRIRQILVM